MARNLPLAALVAIFYFALTPVAEAKKGGGGNWKGPPPHGNAWGHYKSGWPGYWYGGYPYAYGPPIYSGLAPPLGSPAYAPVPPLAPELIPPSLPAPSY
jgi:hypothetical protein